MLVALLSLGASALAQTALTLDGSTTVGPIAKAFAEYTMSQNKSMNIMVSESGSGNGAKSLINGTCDIATLSRFMKEKEFSAAAAAGVMPVAHCVALDGLPIMVHPSNPIRNLSIEQIRDVYMGKITNWSALGGPDLAIVVITRDTNSGTYETFEGLVMTRKDSEGNEVKEKIMSGAEYVGSNGQARQRVQSTPAAIGYAGIGFLDDTVKALAVNGIAPTRRTVQTGEYPIARPLFLFTNGYPRLGTELYKFVTLHLTEEGQDLVEEIGFVPVTSY